MLFNENKPPIGSPDDEIRVDNVQMIKGRGGWGFSFGILKILSSLASPFEFYRVF